MKVYFSFICFLFFFSLQISNVSGQTFFFRDDSFLVLKTNGDTLKNPWAGGFNSVQFSKIDLDLDGVKDLFVFDRTGNRISTYLNSGAPNQIDYTHAPNFIENFPEGLRNWVLLRDYNCDGKMDIFTSSSSGIAAYKNTSNTTLQFTLDTNLIHSNFNPNFINIWNFGDFIPAIDDIDGDGDLDILAIDQSFTRVQYHKNLSMETLGNCDSLYFQLTNKCWGYFKFKNNNVHELFDTCSLNVSNPEDITPIQHLDFGSALLTIDVDSNDTKDLIISSYAKKNFNLLINNDLSGNQTSSSLTSQDTLFPKNNLNTIPLDLNIFPGGYYLDVNNDNIKDLISAPIYPYACKNTNNVWLHKNTHANNKPNFKNIQNDFLQGGMIEVGEGSQPVFFDYNADSLMDIVIGNHGVFDETNQLFFNSSLFLYENIGTANTPIYQLVDTNYAGISSMILNLDSNDKTLGLSPTFGDLDNDNDLDMLIGDYNGYIHYFTNTGGAGNTASFSLTQINYLDIQGSDAKPFLYDLNKDNLLDVIVGNKKGTFTYFENNGTPTNPNFSFVTDSLGKVTTRGFYNPRGNSHPFIIDSSGTSILFSGSESGYLFKYGNIDGNLNGTFSIDSAYLDIWEGIRSSISITDVTNDGILDMLIGNYSGGVAFYNGSNSNSSSIEQKYGLTEIKIYPNPTKNTITINIQENALNNASVKIIDLLGKEIYSQKINHQITTLNMMNYAKGIYCIKFSNNKGSRLSKIVKN